MYTFLYTHCVHTYYFEKHSTLGKTLLFNMKLWLRDYCFNVTEKGGGYLYESHFSCRKFKKRMIFQLCGMPSLKHFFLVMNNGHFQIQYYLSCISGYHSKTLQRKGWRRADIEELRNVVWTHAINPEEYYGLNHCTENVEYSIHIVEDIIRHSTPDSYACELSECAVRIHKQQTHNSKGIEASFALRESMRQFLSLYTWKMDLCLFKALAYQSTDLLWICCNNLTYFFMNVYLILQLCS